MKVTTTTVTTTTEWTVKPAKTPEGSERHYCVWSIPEASAEQGAGVYSGEMPAVWQAIRKQCKDGCFAGSGVLLKRFSSKEECLSNWLTLCPKSRLEKMEVRMPVPPVFEFY